MPILMRTVILLAYHFQFISHFFFFHFGHSLQNLIHVFHFVFHELKLSPSFSVESSLHLGFSSVGLLFIRTFSLLILNEETLVGLKGLFIFGDIAFVRLLDLVDLFTYKSPFLVCFQGFIIFHRPVYYLKFFLLHLQKKIKLIYENKSTQ